MLSWHNRPMDSWHAVDEAARRRRYGTRPIRIAIDRDLTLGTETKEGLVATFLDSVLLYRALDGDELAIAYATGHFEGGMFASREERSWGASWAGTSAEDVASWARAWAKRGRLKKRLFVAVADGKDHVFFREGGRTEVEFDPHGPPVQQAEMDVVLCNTGIGCSVTVSTGDAMLFHVSPTGEVGKKLTKREVERYLAAHPVPDVLLRGFGMGGSWFSGLVLGQGLAVGQDEFDRLWLVQDRNDRTVILGAKTRKAAIDEAKRLIRQGQWGDGVVRRLNRVPEGFDAVRVGDRWERVRGLFGRDAGTVSVVGASYVVIRDPVRGGQWVSAANLMRDWRPV